MCDWAASLCYPVAVQPQAVVIELQRKPASLTRRHTVLGVWSCTWNKPSYICRDFLSPRLVASSCQPKTNYLLSILGLKRPVFLERSEGHRDMSVLDSRLPTTPLYQRQRPASSVHLQPRVRTARSKSTHAHKRGTNLGVSRRGGAEGTVHLKSGTHGSTGRRALPLSIGTPRLSHR